MSALKNLPSDFSNVQLLYENCGFEISELNIESESREYAACSFKLKGKTILFRASKITPTKTGQFVTTWKRNAQGITAPFNIHDHIDFLVISTKEGEHAGQFVFPKTALVEQGIISGAQPGKRGTRVYPPWAKAMSKQAEKTQSWQSAYFLHIRENTFTDMEQAKKLYAVERSL